MAEIAFITAESVEVKEESVEIKEECANEDPLSVSPSRKGKHF